MSLSIKKTPLYGLWLIESESYKDNRGSFSRIFCSDTFNKYGIETRWNQISSSLNYKKHTIRGMHFQKEPYAEIKLVRCTKGKLYDVVVDLRYSSPTFRNYFSIILDENDSYSLYIPKGFAHGFLTLEDNTVIDYFISENFMPEYTIGFNWKDPEVDIKWPANPEVISDKDKSLPNLDALNIDELFQGENN